MRGGRCGRQQTRPAAPPALSGASAPDPKASRKDACAGRSPRRPVRQPRRARPARPSVDAGQRRGAATTRAARARRGPPSQPEVRACGSAGRLGSGRGRALEPCRPQPTAGPDPRMAAGALALRLSAGRPPGHVWDALVLACRVQRLPLLSGGRPHVGDLGPALPGRWPISQSGFPSRLGGRLGKVWRRHSASRGPAHSEWL